MKIKIKTILLMSAVLAGILTSTQHVHAQSQPVWQMVTIQDLPAGCQLAHVWARSRNEAYVWAHRTIANAPQSFLYRWDGWSWVQVLALTNYYGGKIFGTGTSDVFVSAEYYPSGNAGSAFARVFRSIDNGDNWTEETLPPVVANNSLNFGYMGGTPNNVHLHTGSGATSYIVRFDGVNWSTMITNVDAYGLTLAGPNEGYYVTCLSWGSWDGSSWTSRGPASIGCDVYGGVWSYRSMGGALSMYAVGHNNFGNGVRVWGFNEQGQTWSTVLSDGSSGSGLGVWGVSSNDVYVAGVLNLGPSEFGRVYHFDGVSWQVVNEIGSIPRPGGVGGSASDDVWVSLNSGPSLLHFAPPAPSLGIAMYAGITINGSTNAVYQIQFASSMGNTNIWTTLTNLTLPSSPFLFFDASSAGQPMRYYRAFQID